MKNIIDVVADGAFGDSGKGCVTNYLAKTGSYTHVLRFTGGNNCGHTIYNDGKKFVTHLVPCGVFHNKRSVIGPGCVINSSKLKEEILELEKEGIKNIRTNLKIAKNAHIITANHLEEDSKDVKIGTTKTGNGPCYTDKYKRIGKQAGEELKNDEILGPMLVDMYEEFYSNSDASNIILAEGAQGFFLDINHGNYPYVTSGHCGPGSVSLNGFPEKSIRNVYIIIKAYDTYVGAMEFQDKTDPLLDKLQELGSEIGATTGRKRQCNWLNLDNAIKAARMSGAAQVIIKKIDIIDQLGTWKLLHKGNKIEFSSSLEFQTYIKKALSEFEVVFSSNKEGI